jgi:hypothetical protein
MPYGSTETDVAPVAAPAKHPVQELTEATDEYFASPDYLAGTSEERMAGINRITDLWDEVLPQYLPDMNPDDAESLQNTVAGLLKSRLAESGPAPLVTEPMAAETFGMADELLKTRQLSQHSPSLPYSEIGVFSDSEIAAYDTERKNVETAKKDYPQKLRDFTVETGLRREQAERILDDQEALEGMTDKAVVLKATGQVAVPPKRAFDQKQWDSEVDATNATPEAKAKAKAARTKVRDSFSEKVLPLMDTIDPKWTKWSAEMADEMKDTSSGEKIERFIKWQKLNNNVVDMDSVLSPKKPFLKLSDLPGALYRTASAIKNMGPAAYYGLRYGLSRPDKLPPEARAAIARAQKHSEIQAAEQEKRILAGKSSSVTESISEAGQSIPFSALTMGATIAAGAVGSAQGALAGPAGSAAGAVTYGMAASGTAAYRMAGAAFLNEAFSAFEDDSMKKHGKPMTEEQKQALYETLLPIAQNSGLWEAGPEAVGNAVTLGVGKLLFGAGTRLTSRKFIANLVKSNLGKATLAAGAVGTELATETLTQVEQSGGERKMRALLEGRSMDNEGADWTLDGIITALKEVTPQTLALVGMMGGAGAIYKAVVHGRRSAEPTRAAAAQMRATGFPMAAAEMDKTAELQARRTFAETLSGLTTAAEAEGDAFANVPKKPSQPATKGGDATSETATETASQEAGEEVQKLRQADEQVPLLGTEPVSAGTEKPTPEPPPSKPAAVSEPQRPAESSLQQEHRDFLASIGSEAPEGVIVDYVGETGTGDGNYTVRGTLADGSSFYVPDLKPGESVADGIVRTKDKALRESRAPEPSAADTLRKSSESADVDFNGEADGLATFTVRSTDPLKRSSFMLRTADATPERIEQRAQEVRDSYAPKPVAPEAPKPTHYFEQHHPFYDDPLIQEITSRGGLISNAQAPKHLGKEAWESQKKHWTPTPNLPINHRKIYRQGGMTLDKMAGQLSGASGYPEHYTADMLAADIKKASDSATSVAAQMREQSLRGKQGEAFTKEADKKNPGERSIDSLDVSVGDVVKVGTEAMKVTHVKGMMFVLEDGKKYGVQEVEGAIYGKLSRAKSEPAKPAPPPEPSAPKLRPSDGAETGSLLQGDAEPFNLVSETAADKAARERREAADAAAQEAKDAADAQALQDKQQGSLFGDGPQSLSAEAPKTGTPKATAQSVVAKLAARFKGAVPVEVIGDGSEFPQSVKDDAAARGITDLNRIRGVVVDGKIYINARAVESPSQAVGTFFHEAFGHGPIDAYLDTLKPGTAKQLDTLLQRLFPTEHAEVKRQYRPSEQVSETLAKIVESLGPNATAAKRSAWNRFVDWLRTKLVQLGWKNASRKDVDALIRNSIDALKASKESPRTLDQMRGSELLYEAEKAGVKVSNEDTIQVMRHDAAANEAVRQRVREATGVEARLSVGDGDTTSTKKAVTQSEREAEGRDFIETLDRPTREALIDTARAKLETDKDAGRALVREINEGDFNWQVSDAQEALLAAWKRTVRTEKAEQAKRAEDESLSQAQRDLAEERWTELEAENNAIDQATTKTGSAWHRWGMFRQQELRADFSFENLERQRRKAKDGEPLTMEEASSLRKEVETLKVAHEAEIQRRTELEAVARAEAVQAALEQGRAEAAKEAAENAPDPRVAAHSAQFVANLKAEAAKATAGTRGLFSKPTNGGTKFSLAPDTEAKPPWFDDLALHGAAEMAKRNVPKDKWFAALKEHTGDTEGNLDPHREALWDASNRILESKIADDTAESAKAVKAKMKRNASKEQLIEGIRERVAEDGDTSGIGRYLKKLAVKLIGEGVDTREPLVDALHDAVKDIDPSLTRERVMDLWSDYGQFKPATTDSVKVKAAQIRGEVQQVRKLIDMAKGLAAKLTGIGRVEPSAEQRMLTKEVEDAKRRGGFRVTDPTTQLKTALDAIKSRLKNEIADMDYAIATRKPLAEHKNAIVYDAQTKALKAARDAKKAEYETLFPKDTAAADLAAIGRALDRSIAELTDQIQSGKLYPGKVSRKLTSPEIEAKRARIEALRDEREVLRGLDTARVEEAKIKAAQARLDELNRQKAEGWPEQPVGTPTADTAELAALKDQLDTLLTERQRALHPPTDPEMRRIEALDRAIAAKQAKIDAGDTSSPPKSQNVKTKEVTEKEAELKRLNAELAKLRSNDTARQLDQMKARKSRMLADLLDKIARSDFEPKPAPKPKPTDPELQAIEFEVSKAKEAIMEGTLELARSRRTKWQRTKDAVADSFHTLRAIMTGGEFSGVLRQGKLAALSHPILTFKNAVPAMFRGFRSKQGEHTEITDIWKRDNAAAYKRSKLAIHDPKDFTAAQLEGNYRSRWANKIPFIAGSGRAYGTFLNRIRADLFDTLHESVRSKEGAVTPDQEAVISRYVNEMTGSGGLGERGQRAAQALNVVFFAPKFVMSRFQMITGHAAWKADAAGKKLIAKEYAKILTGIAVMYAIYAALKDDKEPIETDPRSSKFGKIPMGNGTYVDPLAGLSQATVFLSRLASGETKDSHGIIHDIRTSDGTKPKFGAANAFDLMTKFARSKLSPVAGATVDWMNGTDFQGKPVTVKGQLINIGTPMTYGDIYDAMRAQGVPRGTVLSALAMFGEGLNTYTDQNITSRLEKELRNGSNAGLLDALKKKEITRDQATEIRKRAAMKPIVSATLHLSAADMQKVYDRASDAEKKDLEYPLRLKKYRARAAKAR